MAAGHILQTAGLAFLAEVGDASFFVAVILAIFCPWRGVRSGKGLCVEYALVILGSVSALLLRVLLRRHELHVAAVTGELVPPLLAASGLAVLSALAFWHWSAARGDPEPAMGDRPGARPAYGGSFLGSFQAYNPAAYAKSESLLEQQPLLAGRMPERSHLTAKVPFIASMLLAFFVPFCVIFVLETGSQGIELEVVRRWTGLKSLGPLRHRSSHSDRSLHRVRLGETCGRSGVVAAMRPGSGSAVYQFTTDGGAAVSGCSLCSQAVPQPAKLSLLERSGDIYEAGTLQCMADRKSVV